MSFNVYVDKAEAKYTNKMLCRDLITIRKDDTTDDLHQPIVFTFISLFKIEFYSNFATFKKSQLMSASRLNSTQT